MKKNVIRTTAKRFEFRETDLSRYIKENTSEDDKILVLGNECNIYLMSERSSDCKYIYQIPVVRVDPTIMEKTIEEIDNKKPKLIVLGHTIYEEVEKSFYKYLEDNDIYEMVYAYKNYDVYRLKTFNE